MSTNAAPGSQKHSRILACVLCQHRKIKCDRNSPCSNCLKANVTCIPSTPAPARKRRRPNQDLQERLARCEELLKQYADGPSPPVQRQLPQIPTTPTTPATNEPQTEAPASTPASSDFHPASRPACVVVDDEGSVRFMDSYVWAIVYGELQQMRKIVETDDPEDSSVFSCDDRTPDATSDLHLPRDVSSTNIEELQPEPVHIFRLWQLYLDRINPLTKAIHVPTMQPYVLEAATNMSGMTLNYQALFFSIFAMAVISMSPIECIQMLGIPRETAIQRFNAGTKAALIKYNYLKNHNMISLQALVIYLVSLDGRHDRHAQWLLSGTVVRIAQKMGYHRDGELLNLTPFETEMRRRLWWHIVMLDSKCAMMCGLTHSCMPEKWDTKTPSNFNDADLLPDSTKPVPERDGPTEMAFCIIVHEIFRCKLDSSDDSPAFEAAVFGQTLENETGAAANDTKAVFEKFRIRAQELEMRLLRLERNFIDVTAGNVHVAALSIRPMLIHRLTDMLIPMSEQPEWGTEIFGPKDNFFKVLVMTLEHKTDAHQRMASAGFQWFMRMHFQLDILAVFTGLLLNRPTGSLADRAWDVARKIYAHHTDLSDMSVKQNVTQAQYTLKAWEAREAAFAQAGRSIDVPPFILRLREIVPSNDSRSSVQPSAPASMTSTPQPLAGYNPFVGGYVDVSAMNWEMFGDFLPDNGGQLSAAMFDGYGLSSMNLGT